MIEPSGLLAPLDRLRRRQQFEAATGLLVRAAGAPNFPEAHRQFLPAIPSIESLPPPLQRLTWLSTLGSSGIGRRHHSRVIDELWSRGIGRSLDGVTAPSGLSQLLATIAAGHVQRMASDLAWAEATHAFSELLPSRQPRSIASEAVCLMTVCSAEQLDRLAMQSEEAKIPDIADIARAARWLHALSTPDAPDAPAPHAALARWMLTAPALRGLRRRGARRLGRRLGRTARQPFHAHASAAASSRSIPMCLRPPEGTADVMAPLLMDYLTSGIRELWHGTERSMRDGAHEFASRFPDACDEIAGFVDGARTTDFRTRLEWIELHLALAKAPQPAAAIGADPPDPEVPRRPNT